MAVGVVRILSDLHYRDRGGLQRLEALQPLLDGVSQVVLNGDTLEARHAGSRELLQEVREFFGRVSPSVTFIAGNHDPDISPLLELQLANNLVWITHGDIFWPDVAPWSRYAQCMKDLIAEERNRRGITESSGGLGDLLASHRVANLRLGARYDPSNQSASARFMQLTRTLLPPTQLLRMAKAWRQAPDRAFGWARKHRPQAKFVLFGHIHAPGIWKDPSTQVVAINTGSFEWPLRGLCVDVSDTALIVRRVIRRRDHYLAGPPCATFPLAEGR
ncbi:MAG: metallophosphoesterase family protein [Opitutaceae bacterium]|nr:metallophosphoesterase family protein [Opitutaceae bacterium]